MNEQIYVEQTPKEQAQPSISSSQSSLPPAAGHSESRRSAKSNNKSMNLGADRNTGNSSLSAKDLRRLRRGRVDSESSSSSSFGCRSDAPRTSSTKNSIPKKPGAAQRDKSLFKSPKSTSPNLPSKSTTIVRRQKITKETLKKYKKRKMLALIDGKTYCVSVVFGGGSGPLKTDSSSKAVFDFEPSSNLAVTASSSAAVSSSSLKKGGHHVHREDIRSGRFDNQNDKKKTENNKKVKIKNSRLRRMSDVHKISTSTGEKNKIKKTKESSASGNASLAPSLTTNDDTAMSKSSKKKMMPLSSHKALPSTPKLLKDKDSESEKSFSSSAAMSSKDTKPAGSSAMTSEAAASPKKEKSRNNKISPESLEFLSSFLSTYKSRDVLDDDEVLDVMTATENAAVARIRRRTEDPSYDCCYSSDEDDVYHDEWWGIGKDGFDLMYGEDFLNKAKKAAALEAATRSLEMLSQKNSKVSAPSLSMPSLSSKKEDVKTGAETTTSTKTSEANTIKPKTLLSKKTIQILRDAMDMHERKDRGFRQSFTENNAVAPELLGKKRKRSKDPNATNDYRLLINNGYHHQDQIISGRLTRGMVRDTRNKRREERDARNNMGVEALVLAVSDIEMDDKKKNECAKKATRDDDSNPAEVIGKNNDNTLPKKKRNSLKKVFAKDVNEDGDGNPADNNGKDKHKSSPNKKRNSFKKAASKEINEGNKHTKQRSSSLSFDLKDDGEEKSENIPSKKLSSIDPKKDKSVVADAVQPATVISKKKKKKSSLPLKDLKSQSSASKSSTLPAPSSSNPSLTPPSSPLLPPSPTSLKPASASTQAPSLLESESSPASSLPAISSSAPDKTGKQQKVVNCSASKDTKVLKRLKKIRVVDSNGVISKSSPSKLINKTKVRNDDIPASEPANEYGAPSSSTTAVVTKKSKNDLGKRAGISHDTTKEKKTLKKATEKRKLEPKDEKAPASLPPLSSTKEKKKRNRDESDVLVDSEDDELKESPQTKSASIISGARKDSKKQSDKYENKQLSNGKKRKRKKSEADLSLPSVVDANSNDRLSSSAEKQKSCANHNKFQNSNGSHPSSTSNPSGVKCLMAVLPGKDNDLASNPFNYVRVVRVVVDGKTYKSKRRKLGEDGISISQSEPTLPTTAAKKGDIKCSSSADDKLDDTNKSKQTKKGTKKLPLNTKQSALPDADGTKGEKKHTPLHKTPEENSTTVKVTGCTKLPLASNEKRRRKSIKSPSKRNRKVLPTAKKRSQVSVDGLNEGPLFGELTNSVLNGHASDNICASGAPSISLGLLDWRRRQQWLPTPKKSDNFDHASTDSSESALQPGLGTKANILVPYDLAHSKNSNGVPLWETINPSTSIPEQPSTLEPPCRKHTNKIYAILCGKMINFLNNSGRHFPRYEFFYSDIDRAWFNHNQFRNDVAKLGVPLTAKLTRSEWSSVRRCLPKRPRRFSKRFIESQMRQLNEYRQFVRDIQNNPESDAVKDCGFEVPAPIKVGAVVTAYNKYARFLHRGVILTRDVAKQGYLVQFERKSFGYEFCPDTEVASHGVPDTIIPPPEIELDGSSARTSLNQHIEPGVLPSGTAYGPLVDHHKEENKRAINQMTSWTSATHPVTKTSKPDKRISSLSQNGASVLTTKKTEGNNLNSHGSSGSSVKKSEDEGNTSLSEKAAERETLVKLMCSLDAMFERKTMLLDAMEKCHKSIQDYIHSATDRDGPLTTAGERKSQIEVLRGEGFRPFREHLAWLHANMKLNNQSLETALVFLQVLYSKSYVGRPGFIRTEDKEKERLSKESQIRNDSRAFVVNDDNGKAWSEAVSRGSISTGNEIASQLDGKVEGSNMDANADEREQCSDSITDKNRLRYLESRMSSSLGLLLTSEMCSRFLEKSKDKMDPKNSFESLQDGHQVVHAGAAREVLQKAVGRLTPHEIPGLIAKSDGLELRDAGFGELKEAVSMLHAELAALSSQESRGS